MRILLPPSEGKTAAIHGPACDLATLSFHEQLSAIRARQWRLQPLATTRCPSAPAHSVYSGVLYAALGYPSLRSAARTRADRSIVIISALFGALRLTDEIPAYKATMSSSLWRTAVTEALDADPHEVVVDCRSSTYAGVYTPPANRTVAVRVFKQSGRQRTVITHMSKHYRGLVARALVMSARTPRTPEAVAHLVSQDWQCELSEPSGRKPWLLDVIVKV